MRNIKDGFLATSIINALNPLPTRLVLINTTTVHSAQMQLNARGAHVYNWVKRTATHEAGGKKYVVTFDVLYAHTNYGTEYVAFFNINAREIVTRSFTVLVLD